MTDELDRISDDEELDIDIAQALGADDQTSIQVLTLYIPNKDLNGIDIRDQRKWVREGAAILAEIGGGVTIMPPVEGGWINEDGIIIWEHPIILYSYVKPESFV